MDLTDSEALASCCFHASGRLLAVARAASATQSRARASSPKASPARRPSGRSLSGNAIAAPTEVARGTEPLSSRERSRRGSEEAGRSVSPERGA
jgi:hypothetical protein